jgi:hypothetical protein
MSPPTITVIVLLCIFGGALLGFVLQKVLPEKQLSSESRQAVNLGMGIIGTMSALVLGLLVASAKGTYDAQNDALIQVSARVIFLDQTLRDYGPEAQETRFALRQAVENAINGLWPQKHAQDLHFEPGKNLPRVYRYIEQLKPKDDNQRAAKDRAMTTIVSLMQTGSLAAVQQTVSISAPLLVILIFWLTINFISLGLFAPRNATVIATLFLCALAVSGAILLILELYNPFGGLIHVPSEPMHVALERLSQ